MMQAAAQSKLQKKLIQVSYICLFQIVLQLCYPGWCSSFWSSRWKKTWKIKIEPHQTSSTLHCAPVKLQGIHVHISVEYFFSLRRRRKLFFISWVFDHCGNYNHIGMLRKLQELQDIKLRMLLAHRSHQKGRHVMEIMLFKNKGY